ncbi:MAG: hypothetical protein HC905_25065 [Bacteroidales bacterium]|nr:hypothetical protein [Bacteroidales bacterium]
MKRNNLFYLFILYISTLLLSWIKLDAQSNYDKTFTLSTCLAGGIWEARDWIVLGPGTYNPTSYDFDARINESLLFSLEPQTMVDPDSRAINTSFVIGSTPGNLSVTQMGSSLYEVPISVPPGTAGVQPNISIVYNSMTGNGIVGFGANISGLSSIVRVPKNIYNDGSSGKVSLDYNDRFTIDGNRLVLTTGSYGYANSEYRTEIETYIKITAKNTAGNGPSYFEIKTKDGYTLEYGNTTDSKVEAYGNSTVLMWRLNKFTDNNGNYIEYVYGETLGESYIKKN